MPRSTALSGSPICSATTRRAMRAVAVHCQLPRPTSSIAGAESPLAASCARSSLARSSRFRGRATRSSRTARTLLSRSRHLAQSRIVSSASRHRRLSHARGSLCLPLSIQAARDARSLSRCTCPPCAYLTSRGNTQSGSRTAALATISPTQRDSARRYSCWALHRSWLRSWSRNVCHGLEPARGSVLPRSLLDRLFFPTGVTQSATSKASAR
jgi:hypothetical protein